MKLIFSTKTSIFAAGYLAATFCVLVGLQLFLSRQMDVNILASAITLVHNLTAFVFKLTGWTIIGFFPLGLRVAYHGTSAVIQGQLNPKHRSELHHLAEIAIGIGMLGTLWAFISTASAYAETTTASDPQSTLMAILIGLGSTMAGVAIAMAGQLILYFFPEPNS